VALSARGVPVGRAWVGVQGGALFVSDVIVDEARRGRGIGTALMAAAEDFAVERGVELIELEVEQTNPDARRLYERIGYSVVGERPCCESDEPGWVMQKPLCSRSLSISPYRGRSTRQSSNR